MFTARPERYDEAGLVGAQKLAVTRHYSEGTSQILCSSIKVFPPAADSPNIRASQLVKPTF